MKILTVVMAAAVWGRAAANCPNLTVTDAATGRAPAGVEAALASVADPAGAWAATVKAADGRDHALTVRIEWPLAGDGAVTWAPQPLVSETLAADAGERIAGEPCEGGCGLLAKWPLAVTAVGRSAAAVAFDPRHPAYAQLGCDPRRRVAFASFDVALTPEKPSAELRALRFECADGFRGALARWTEIFAELFRVRTDRYGVWMPFARISAVEGWRDFGFAFKEGDNEPDWDDAHDVLTFHYTEPCTFWMDMPGPTNSYTLADCVRAASNFCAATHARRGKVENAVAAGVTEAFGSTWADCVFHGADGRPVGSIHDLPWCRGAVWSLNDAPGIPGEWTGWRAKQGAFIHDARYARPFPQGVDGEYVDSAELYVTAPFDFRRGHFAAMRTPLAWESKTRRPGVYKGMIAYEYVRGTSEAMHARGRFAMANGTPLKWWWLAPWLDVLGTETDWCDWRGGRRAWTPPTEEEFLLWRALAGRKPFCFLMNTDFTQLGPDRVRKFFEYSLAYGCCPGFFSADAASGHYFKNPKLYNRDRPLFLQFIPLVRMLDAAGWRPVNRLVRCATPGVACEQFGDGFVTVFNRGGETRRVELTRADGASGETDELVTGGKWTWDKGACAVEIPAESVRVVRLHRE